VRERERNGWGVVYVGLVAILDIIHEVLSSSSLERITKVGDQSSFMSFVMGIAIHLAHKDRYIISDCSFGLLSKL